MTELKALEEHKQSPRFFIFAANVKHLIILVLATPHLFDCGTSTPVYDVNFAVSYRDALDRLRVHFNFIL